MFKKYWGLFVAIGVYSVYNFILGEIIYKAGYDQGCADTYTACTMEIQKSTKELQKILNGKTEE